MKTNSRTSENALLPIPTQLEPEAVTVDDFARWAGIGRTMVYRAMSSDAAYRGALPYLPSLKLRRARRIRLETGRAWLRDLEAQTSGSDA